MRDHPVRAVFLDRDGVINRNRPDYVKAWEEFEFLPGALKALERLAGSPFYIVVVTNQSAVGRGLVSRGDIDGIHTRMERAIRGARGRVDAIYYCPHTPADGCDCRKPRPGLLFQAAEKLQLDLAASYLVGDDLSDAEAALAAGVRPVLLRPGCGNETSPDLLQGKALIFDDLEGFAKSLLARDWGNSWKIGQCSMGQVVSETRR